MTVTQIAAQDVSGPVDIGDANVWVERRGKGFNALVDEFWRRVDGRR